ncbi:MAG: sugar ABC transporter substrate-binding protein [Acidobacteriota bacterium]|nr:sugar ABC transporter substrate-binding protein [Acidobacteriota bacterium]
MTQSITRRALIASGLGAAACGRKDRRSDRKTRLQFSFYGEPIEVRTFDRIIARYQQLHPDVEIEREHISYQSRPDIDTLIAAGLGPDVFRVQYMDVGRYSPSNALIDLSRYLPSNFGDQFTPQTWAAVQYKGRPHALPHQTDTSAILYNKTLFNRLGIRAPQSIEESWSWGEFIDVARALKRGGCEFAFAVNWVLGGSFRWLNFLYQRGGCLLQHNYKQSAVPSDEALSTIKWTQSFFREGLVPMSDSAKSSEQLEYLFASGVVGMYFDVGPQTIRELKTDFEWAATFLPQDRQKASELGGNAVGVSRTSKHPELAADFALFLTDEENMREFVTAAEFLPVRRKLIAEGIQYRYRPDEMRVHLEQSKTVPLGLARTVTLPEFHRIERVLGDELDLAFTGGQAAETTLENIAREVRRTTGQL